LASKAIKVVTARMQREWDRLCRSSLLDYFGLVERTRCMWRHPVLSYFAVGCLQMAIVRREATRFKREFKTFLAALGYRLKHFLPDDYFGERMFPECLIPRSTGYDKLRGQGRLSEDLAILWVRRAERFLEIALENAQRDGK
jgi:hypothetical protein